MKTLLTSLTFCISALCAMQVSAMEYETDTYEALKFEGPEILNQDEFLLENQLLAENDNGSNSNTQPADGTLIIPGASEDTGHEKKCVTVCDEWGKDCVINPVTGQRKCRRMCKSFGQECI